MDKPSLLSPIGNIPTFVCARGPDGIERRFINRMKYPQKLYMLRSTDFPLVVAANLEGRTTLVPDRDQGEQGDAELFYAVATSTGQFAVELYMSHINRRLMNGPVESSLVFGASMNEPGRVLDGIFVPSTTAIDVRVVDLSGAPNNVRLAMMGHQIIDTQRATGYTPQEVQQLYLKRNTHPFWLTTDVGSQVTIPANGNLTVTMRVPPAADFEAYGLLVRSNQGVDSFDLQVFEGQRRALSQNQLPVEFVAGQTFTMAATAPNGGLVTAASRPLIFPFTHLFQRTTVISIDLTDTSGVDNVVSLAFPGRLIYYPQAPAGLPAPGLQPWGPPLPGVRGAHSYR